MERQKNIIEHVLDHRLIHQLIDNYTYMINQRKWEELPDLFTVNATWKAIAPIDLEFVGLDMIRIKIPENVEKLQVLFQQSSEIMITVQTAEHAIVHSRLTETGRFRETSKGLYAIGVYQDQVIKENGIWKFIKREFLLKYIDNDYPFNGTIINEFN